MYLRVPKAIFSLLLLVCRLTVVSKMSMAALWKPCILPGGWGINTDYSTKTWVEFSYIYCHRLPPEVRNVIWLVFCQNGYGQLQQTSPMIWVTWAHKASYGWFTTKRPNQPAVSSVRAIMSVFVLITSPLMNAPDAFLLQGSKWRHAFTVTIT